MQAATASRQTVRSSIVTPPGLPAEGFVRLNALVGEGGVLGVGRTTFYSWIEQGLAPKPVKVGVASLWGVAGIRELMARIEAGEFSDLKRAA